MSSVRNWEGREMCFGKQPTDTLIGAGARFNNMGVYKLKWV